MKFGLACEGITDQISLENILCGYFDIPDLDEEIHYVQPFLDETDKKQHNQGGWEPLLGYLRSSLFREDVLNTDYVILQIDTDDSEHINFGINHQDNNNQPLTAEKLIDNIKTRLIVEINSGEQNFYDERADKLIFAISVHSLECWLYAHYNTKSLKKPKITGCYRALEHLCTQKKLANFKKIEKTYHCYDKLSGVFLKRKNIDNVATKDPSFKCFIDNLGALDYD
ncbi:MAG: hypothetical protein KAJ63_09190, partial [Methyloprofundus sp.]|nr:hypothetical protein [Methyloprofundus sp.]